jgi:hypothetical protein
MSIAAGSGTTTDGLRIQGDTGGYGALIIGGATGHGAEFRGGATSGSGCRMVAQTLGEGLVCSAIGGTNAGIQANGGGTGAGIEATGASTGAGFRIAGGVNGPGMLAVGGATTGAGFKATVTAGQIEFDVDISSFAAGAITNNAFAAGAIDAAAIATDAIGANEFSQAAADKIWSSATRTLTAFSFSVTASVVGDKTGYSLSSTGTDLIDIDGKTLSQALKIIAATTAGKISGAGTGVETFVGLNGTSNRAVVTTDANGNRTAVTYP